MSKPKLSAPAAPAEPPTRQKLPRQRMAESMGQEAGDDGEADGAQFVESVARALAVLNAFRPGDDPLGNAEIAERTGLPKPTVSRLTYTLTRCGYLAFNPRFRVYELGVSAMALGNVALASVNVRLLARPLMRELALKSNCNVGLGTRDRHLMIYTDACESEALVGLRLLAGSRIPIITSAMGRAYFAGVEQEEREALLAELRPRYGDEWGGLHKALMDAVERVERDGFCISAGDWQKDIHGVAAPIRSSVGGPVYAVNLGGPAYLLPESKLIGELGPRVAELARNVQAALAPEGVDIGTVIKQPRHR